MLKLGDLTLSSRLIVGTGKYPDFATMRACHEASGTAMVTLALPSLAFARAAHDSGQSSFSARCSRSPGASSPSSA